MKIVKNEENLSQKIVFKLLKYNPYKNLQCFMLFYGKKDENHIPRDLLRIGQRGLYKTKLPRKRKNNRNSSKYNNLSERNELIQRLKMRIKSSSLSLSSLSSLSPSLLLSLSTSSTSFTLKMLRTSMTSLSLLSLSLRSVSSIANPSIKVRARMGSFALVVSLLESSRSLSSIVNPKGLSLKVRARIGSFVLVVSLLESSRMPSLSKSLSLEPNPNKSSWKAHFAIKNLIYVIYLIYVTYLSYVSYKILLRKDCSRPVKLFGIFDIRYIFEIFDVNYLSVASIAKAQSISHNPSILMTKFCL